jgi:hypothetical protein
MPVFPGKNNSKKISELKPRDVITQHKDHSWIPVAQYDSRIGSYTNFAISIEALTDYSDAYSYMMANEAIGYLAYSYQLDTEWKYLQNIGNTYNAGYITEELNNAFTYSYIAQNLVTYAFSYTDEMHGWEYLYGHYEVDITARPEYLYTDLEQYILTEDGRKIIIDNE